MIGRLTPHWGREFKSWAAAAPTRARVLKTAVVTFMMAAVDGIRVGLVGIRSRDWVTAVTGCCD